MPGSLPPPDLTRPTHLLPLLVAPANAPHASQPPLSQLPLPLGHPTPPRLPFRPSQLTGSALSSTPAPLPEARDDEWIVTTHLYPAAYPRSSPLSTTPSSPSPSLHQVVVAHPPGLTAAELKSHERKTREHDLARFDAIHDALPPLDRLYPSHSAEEAQRRAESIAADATIPQLWGCVQRFRRKGGRPRGKKGKGITLVYAHANGFHKEIYEPAIQYLLESLEALGGDDDDDETWVDEVWNLDSVNSGEAGILNRASLGQELAWTDAPRDILQLLRHYIPDSEPASHGAFPSSSFSDLPTILPRRPDDGALKSGRSFVGVGHSFSGAAVSLLATCEPDLFKGVFILDPVVGFPAEEWVDPVPSQVPLARSAVARQSYWPTRLSASTYLSARPFFQAWHPSVLSLHVSFGFRALEPAKDAEGPCTLSTTKWSEALAFANSWMGRFALQNVRLVGSNYRGKAHVVTMSQTPIYGPTEAGFAREMRATFVRCLGGNVSEEELQGGHLVAQEQPQLLGRLMAGKLKEWFGGEQRGKARL